MERALERKAVEAEILRKVAGGSCGELHSQARKLVRQGYEPKVVASALSISRSSLYYRNRPRCKVRKAEDPDYRETLLSTLHCPPAQYGINRTTWTTKLLGKVMAARGYRAGHNTVSKIIKSAGYRFRKAREVLTSNDPHYKDKLRKITSVLSRLGPEERFFSIDEFGPFSVKKTGGRRLVAASEYPTVPQWQRSKGVLIVTAALELSTNQITHFYSEKKNSHEMIKLLDVLTTKYSGCKRIYFSWDAASWHASKLFLARVEVVNEYHHRKRHLTPAVKLAPLPARAQFLNVIESVFSGLATAIIHNSDYQSVDDAKVAIDRYFMERNEHFRQHPRRAGNKIWGEELVASEFREGQNCKHPGWR
jgi:transposase